MPVIADVSSNGIANIVGYLSCSKFNDFKALNFIVDTGSDITTILPVDSLRLDIDFAPLKKSKEPCVTAKGEIYAYVLPNVQVNLSCNDGKKGSLAMFPLRQIHCLKPSDFTRRNTLMVKFPYSLLGMDVLRYFTKWNWNFDDKTLTLDY